MGRSEASIRCPRCDCDIKVFVSEVPKSSAEKKVSGKSDARIVYDALERWEMRSGSKPISRSELIGRTRISAERIHRVMREFSKREMVAATGEYGKRGKLKTLYVTTSRLWKVDPDNLDAPIPEKEPGPFDELDAAFGGTTPYPMPEVEVPDPMPENPLGPPPTPEEEAEFDRKWREERAKKTAEMLKKADENDPLLKPTE